MDRRIEQPNQNESKTDLPELELNQTSKTEALPFLAHWATKGAIMASTDMRNPDTATWRGDTQDADT